MQRAHRGFVRLTTVNTCLTDCNMRLRRYSSSNCKDVSWPMIAYIHRSYWLAVLRTVRAQCHVSCIFPGSVESLFYEFLQSDDRQPHRPL